MQHKNTAAVQMALAAIAYAGDETLFGTISKSLWGIKAKIEKILNGENPTDPNLATGTDWSLA